MELTQAAEQEQVAERRQRILALQTAIQGHEQADCPVRHLWAPGLYLREMFIPAGVCAVGRVHLFAHANFVLGDVTVYAPEGEGRLTGYETFVKPAGTKLAVLAHSDTWWTTVHPNPDNERDVTKLEALFTSESFEQADAQIATTKQGALQ